MTLIWEIIARAQDHERWMEQVAHTGYCHHPIRIQGSIRQVDKATGEIREVYSSDHEVDQTLLLRCGNRRESRCASCATVYRADAYQLVAAGLRGGKGVPDSVATHPRLFVTLTAPSFGAVHSRSKKGHRYLHCRPRHGNQRCPHGRPLACWTSHAEDDPCLGNPICSDCFDYSGQVIWNALAPELWRCTPTYIERVLGRLAGIRAAELEETVHIEFIKVAEFQRRGAIHFHAVMRLDAARSPEEPDQVAPPPASFTPELFAEAVRRGVEAVKAPYPRISGERPGGYLRWGSIDIRNITATEGAGEVSPEAVAFYVGKYATKSTEAMEDLDRRLKETDLDALQGRSHIVGLVKTAWLLGGRPSLAKLKLRERAHGLGFGGHWHTKSRRYSTTFTRLCRARPEYTRRRQAEGGILLDAWGRPEDEQAVVVIKEGDMSAPAIRAQERGCWRSRARPEQGKNARPSARRCIGRRGLLEREGSKERYRWRTSRGSR
ncbi:MAG: replication initiator [Actinomycetota bacterium]